MADMQENEHHWLTMAEACQTLNVSERTLHRYIKQDKYSSGIDKGRRLVRLTMAERDRQLQTASDTD